MLIMVRDAIINVPLHLEERCKKSEFIVLFSNASMIKDMKSLHA